MRSTATAGPLAFFPPPGALPGSFHTSTWDMNYFGTVRGRLGIAADRALFYVTGGLAYGGIEHAVVTSLALPEERSMRRCRQYRSRMTVGAGFEWAFAPSWSLKAEYLYFDLGDTSVLQISPTFTPPFSVLLAFENTGHIVRAASIIGSARAFDRIS